MENISQLNTEYIVKENLEKICRFCLSQNTIASIFQINYKENAFVDMINVVFPYEISPDDELPTNLCETCIYEIVRLYNFKKTYEKSQEILRNLISQDASHIVLEVEEIIINATPNLDSDDTAIKLDSNKQVKSTAIREETQIKPKVEKIKKPPKTYKCTCEEIFTSRSEYLHHRKKTKHPRKIQQCPVCNKILWAHFSQHMKSHSAIKEHECSICKARFVQNCTLKRHMLIHTGEKPHVCEFCGQAFARKSILQEHRYGHTGEKPYLCEHCGKGFNSSTKLAWHVCRVCKASVLCFICGKSFQSNIHLSFHTRQTHHVSFKINHLNEKEYQCTICKLMLQETEINTHISMHKSEPKSKNYHKCNICEKNFSTKVGLQVHVNAMHNEKRQFYPCDLCDKIYATKAYLKSHVLTHTNEGFICEICSKMFTLANQLKRHIKIMHNGEKPYKCPYCHKDFSHNGNLKQHIRIHTKETAYASENTDSLLE